MLISPPVHPGLAVAIALSGKPKYLIAAEAGMPPNVLSGINSGRVPLTPDRLARLAAALGCAEADLIDGEAG
jgi:transcriptional regulator with XRE-family HTH domain